MGTSFLSLYCRIIVFVSITIAHPHRYSTGSQYHALPPSLSVRDYSTSLNPRQAPHDAIKGGGWLLSYKTSDATYDGMMRVENNNTHLIISGDLYERGSAPDPAAGIPIFPASSHNSYVRVTGYKQNTDGFDLVIEFWQSSGKDTSSSLVWTGAGNTNFTAAMSRRTSPSGFPSADNYFEGDVKSITNGSVSGQLTMGWISNFFRKLTVEIDTVPNAEVPESDGGEHTWQSVFAAVGYDLTLDISDRNVEEPANGAAWTGPQLHAAMLKYRKPVDFSKEWRIHLLVVKKIGSTVRGTMYDSGSNDADKLPREGSTIAANWKFGYNIAGVPDGSKWGDIQNKRFGEVTAAFFRAAVHEVTHALGLWHPIDHPEFRHDFDNPPFDLGFMTPTEEYLRYQNAIDGPKFPANIQWSFHPADQLWLKHLSDQQIRPAFSEFAGFDFYTPTNPGNIVQRDLIGIQEC